MIKIGQTRVFLKDYVHIHQMGSHFVGGYWLDFSPSEQESNTSILQAFLPSAVLHCWRRNKIKKLPNLSVLDENAFLQRYV